MNELIKERRKGREENDDDDDDVKVLMVVLRERKCLDEPQEKGNEEEGLEMKPSLW